MSGFLEALKDLPEVLSQGTVNNVSVSSDGLVVLLTDGRALSWDPMEIREPATTLILDGHFEPAETALLEVLARECDFIVDVGANIGYYTTLFAMANRYAEIVAVEPISTTRARLEQTLALNQLQSRILVVPMALADLPGTATMFIPDYSGNVACSLRRLHPDEGNSTVSVDVSTFDEVLAPRIPPSATTLIKVDIEGAEHLFLRGATSAISRGAIFFIELSRKWLAAFNTSAAAILDDVFAEGYTCFAISKSDSQLFQLRPVTVIDERTVETNFLLVPRVVPPGIWSAIGQNIVDAGPTGSTK